MARRPRRPKIPLKHRLPNAPPVFVGRDREVAWLTTALERSPVAMLRGPGGIGKTALALYTLATAFPKELARTLYVPIRADEAPDQVRLTIAHLLASAAGAEDTVDIAGLRGDPEELTALAIDLAEEGPFWVVIDDLQHTDREEMGELLRQLAAYARDSRWIVTTRDHEDLPELEAQVLDVDRLASASLAELAQELHPDRGAGDLQAAISAASGSPWLLKQYLASGGDGLSHTRAGILESLSEDARDLLHVLAILETPFDLATVGGLVAVPEEAELDRLAARGLLIRSSTGLSVHDQVGDFLFPANAEDGRDAERRSRLADALSARREPDAVLEALRLHGEAGRVDPLVGLLDELGHELMGLGFAPRLWGLIGQLTDRRLGLWQLRCAAELGNATVLAAVRPPRLSSDEDQLAWAATQYLMGEREEARRIALAVRHASTDAGLRTEAGLLAARALLHLGRAQETADELAAMDGPRSFTWRALEALVGAALDRDGSGSETAALLEEARGEVDPEALLDLATSFYRNGDRDRADELIDRVLSTPRGGRASLLVARRAHLLRARARIDRGQLSEAAALLDLVRPYARGTSVLRPLLIELDANRRLAMGDLEGLESAIERGVELARHADAGVTRRLIDLRDELAQRRARTPTESDAAVPEGASPWEPADDRRLRESLASARNEFSGGDLSDAIDDARRIRRDARAAGLALVEAEALLLLADGLMAGLYIEELSGVTNALNDLADALHSPRLRHHAAFYESHGEAGVLERLASEDNSAPRAARRARALLGARVELDTVDEMVVAAARMDWTDLSVELVRGAAGDAWSPAWGLDASQSAVWLPDGRLVPLQKKPLLFRVLSTLADHGGSATKEELINEAWGEAEYHPLKHDPKLHVSIRALRKAIEDDPSAPTRLLTTEDGYVLGGTVRRVLVTT